MDIEKQTWCCAALLSRCLIPVSHCMYWTSFANDTPCGRDDDILPQRQFHHIKTARLARIPVDAPHFVLFKLQTSPELDKRHRGCPARTKPQHSSTPSTARCRRSRTARSRATDTSRNWSARVRRPFIPTPPLHLPSHDPSYLLRLPIFHDAEGNC